MFTVRKQFRFEMAHQLLSSYTSECNETIHGHSYILEVFISSNRLDENDMVIDFGQIKDLMSGYIEQWDHALVMSACADSDYLKVLKDNNKKLITIPNNPTSEYLSMIMYNAIKDLFTIISDIKLVKIRLHESESSWSEYGE